MKGIYKHWIPQTVSRGTIWVRKKEGADHMPPIIVTTGPVVIGPENDLLFEKLSAYEGIVLAVEVPGQGRSDVLRKRNSIKDMALEMQLVINQVLGETVPPVLVGHCFGADIMHTLSKEMHVAGTVMLNSIPTETWFGLSKPIITFHLRTMWNILIRKPLRRTKSIEYETHMADVIDPTKYNSTPWRVFKSLLNVLRLWKTKMYGQTKENSPTLLVTGQYDKQCPKAKLEEMAYQISNARVEVIQNSGHMTILVQPKQVAEMIVRFAKGLA